MNEAIFLSITAPLLLAALGYIVALLVRLNRRIRALERRDRLSWLYIRALVDHAYKAGATPIPPPPEGWDDLLD